MANANATFTHAKVTMDRTTSQGLGDKSKDEKTQTNKHVGPTYGISK